MTDWTNVMYVNVLNKYSNCWNVLWQINYAEFIYQYLFISELMYSIGYTSFKFLIEWCILLLLKSKC